MPRKKSEYDELVERVKQLEEIVEGLSKTLLNITTKPNAKYLKRCDVVLHDDFLVNDDRRYTGL